MSDLSVSGVGPLDNGGKKGQDVQKEEETEKDMKKNRPETFGLG